jgi:hypothetical protein
MDVVHPCAKERSQLWASSLHASLSVEGALRRCRGVGVPVILPSHGSTIRHPLPSTGSPEVGFPRFPAGRSDAPAPSAQARPHRVPGTALPRRRALGAGRPARRPHAQPRGQAPGAPRPRDLPSTLRVRAIRYQRRGFRALTLFTSLRAGARRRSGSVPANRRSRRASATHTRSSRGRWVRMR